MNVSFCHAEMCCQCLSLDDPDEVANLGWETWEQGGYPEV